MALPAGSHPSRFAVGQDGVAYDGYGNILRECHDRVEREGERERIQGSIDHEPCILIIGKRGIWFSYEHIHTSDMRRWRHHLDGVREI